jgi:hypothetical protein
MDSTEDPLWEFAKYVFDFAAKRHDGILAGLEMVYESLEDFCTLKDIRPSPFCQLIFEKRGGFLTQSKLPYYHRDEWNNFFPDPIHMTYAELPQVLIEYQHFLEERKSYGDAHALLYLKKYQDSKPI